MQKTELTPELLVRFETRTIFVKAIEKVASLYKTTTDQMRLDKVDDYTFSNFIRFIENDLEKGDYKIIKKENEPQYRNLKKWFMVFLKCFRPSELYHPSRYYSSNKASAYWFGVTNSEIRYLYLLDVVAELKKRPLNLNLPNEFPLIDSDSINVKLSISEIQ